MAINIRKILLIDEFLQSCRAIKREKGRYLFLFYQFVWFAGLIKISYSDSFLIFNFILCAILALTQNIEIRKVITVVLIYLAMIAIPIGVYGLGDKMFNQYVGYAIRILTGCFIASYFRSDFISKFENLVFVLTYISIPLLILQLVNPHLFDFFTPFSRTILDSKLQNYISHNTGFTMHQYILVFTFNPLGDTFRNSGFMWEPGAFAMMLTWVMLFLLYLNRFQWHRRMIVYVIAMLSTFSLLGYPSLFLMLIIYLAQKSDYKKIGYTLAGGGLVFLLLTQTTLFQEQRDMMTNKVDFYANKSKGELSQEKTYVNEKESSRRVGRIAQFYILGDILRDDPFGKGMSQFKYESANGFVNLIVKWGIWALLILVVSTYSFVKYLEYVSRLHLHWYIILMSMAVFLMPTISNPVYNRVFFLTLIVFPLFVKKTNLKINAK